MDYKLLLVCVGGAIIAHYLWQEMQEMRKSIKDIEETHRVLLEGLESGEISLTNSKKGKQNKNSPAPEESPSRQPPSNTKIMTPPSNRSPNGQILSPQPKTRQGGNGAPMIASQARGNPSQNQVPVGQHHPMTGYNPRMMPRAGNTSKMIRSQPQMNQRQYPRTSNEMMSTRTSGVGKRGPAVNSLHYNTFGHSKKSEDPFEAQMNHMVKMLQTRDQLLQEIASPQAVQESNPEISPEVPEIAAIDQPKEPQRPKNKKHRSHQEQEPEIEPSFRATKGKNLDGDNFSEISFCPLEEGDEAEEISEVSEIDTDTEEEEKDGAMSIRSWERVESTVPEEQKISVTSNSLPTNTMANTSALVETTVSARPSISPRLSNPSSNPVAASSAISEQSGATTLSLDLTKMPKAQTNSMSAQPSVLMTATFNNLGIATGMSQVMGNVSLATALGLELVANPYYPQANAINMPFQGGIKPQMNGIHDFQTLRPQQHDFDNRSINSSLNYPSSIRTL
jgi:hypothetical protein